MRFGDAPPPSRGQINSSSSNNTNCAITSSSSAAAAVVAGSAAAAALTSNARPTVAPPFNTNTAGSPIPPIANSGFGRIGGGGGGGGGSGGSSSFPKIIKFKSTLRNTVIDVMRSRGWKETEHPTDWNFIWADKEWVKESFDQTRLRDDQHVNHFRNHYELTRKDLMVKNLKRMKKALEKEGKLEEASKFDFFPATFSLPADWTMFEMEFKRSPNQTWIMKPPARAQGKGIFLFSKMSQVAEWKTSSKFNEQRFRINNNAPTAAAVAANNNNNAANNNADGGGAGGGGGGDNNGPVGIDANGDPEPYLAQKYIDNPLLVGGKKFDMRIYVLVTSYSPLVVWLHRTAFCRFTQNRFTMDNIDDTFTHVTNVAVQKTNPKYANQTGCKWGVRNLRQYMQAVYGESATNKCFSDIQMLILRSLQSVQRIMMNDKHCAEILGYDIMLTNTLKPMLIEINASPSLTAETPADYHLKFNMLEDFFNVIDLEKRRSGDEMRVGGFDMIWKNGPVGPSANDPAHCTMGSYLGCANELEIPHERISYPPKLMGINSSERSLT